MHQLNFQQRQYCYLLRLRASHQKLLSASAQRNKEIQRMQNTEDSYRRRNLLKLKTLTNPFLETKYAAVIHELLVTDLVAFVTNVIYLLK